MVASEGDLTSETVITDVPSERVGESTGELMHKRVVLRRKRGARSAIELIERKNQINAE